MLFKNQRVSIPNNTKIYKTKSGSYVYFVLESSYLKDRQYNIEKRINIGKIDPENKKMMIPNEKYVALFPDSKIEVVEENNGVSSSLSIGQFLAFKKAMSELFIDQTLGEIFGEKAELIQALISYFIDEESTVAQLFDKWSYRNFSGLLNIPSNSTISNLFNKYIDEEKINLFNIRWANQSRLILNNLKDIFLAMDSTNFNISSKNIPNAEYGMAKVKEGLPQINLAYALDQKTGLPLFYDLYPGSVNDVSQCKKLIEKMRSFKYENATLVLDKGYFSMNNLDDIINSGLDFIIMAKSQNKKLNKMILELGTQMKNNSKYWNIDHEIFNIKLYDAPFSSSDNKYHIFIFFDKDKEKIEVDHFNKTLKLMKNNLKNVKYLTDEIYRTYSKFFEFKVDENNKILSFSHNHENYQQMLDNAGFFAIVSSKDFSPSEILDFYKGRDVIEKTFRAIKTHIDFKKVGSQSAESFESKLFLCFIASIIRSWIYNRIKSFIKQNSGSTFATVMGELSKIEIQKSEQFYNFKYVLTRKQKELLELLGIDEKFINEEMKNINLKLA